MTLSNTSLWTLNMGSISEASQTALFLFPREHLGTSAVLKPTFANSNVITQVSAAHIVLLSRSSHKQYSQFFSQYLSQHCMVEEILICWSVEIASAANSGLNDWTEISCVLQRLVLVNVGIHPTAITYSLNKLSDQWWHAGHCIIFLRISKELCADAVGEVAKAHFQQSFRLYKAALERPERLGSWQDRCEVRYNQACMAALGGDPQVCPYDIWNGNNPIASFTSKLLFWVFLIRHLEVLEDCERSLDSLFNSMI